MRRSEQRRAAVVALYQADVTGRPPGELLDCAAPAFARELVEGAAGEREALDELIARHSRNWSLERIAPLERSIMRVALFELLHRPDVPAEVAIDEAVEAAKELCGIDAPGFVNGILASVHRGRRRRDEVRVAGAGGAAARGREAMSDRLDALVGELEAVAARLRSGDLPAADAAALVERCAELAGRLGAELEADSRAAAESEGQERLL